MTEAGASIVAERSITKAEGWTATTITATTITASRTSRMVLSMTLSSLVDQLAELALLRDELRRRFREFLGLVHLADLDLGVFARIRVRAAQRQVDGFLARLHVHDPEAADQLLGLGERAVDDRALAGLGDAHARAPDAGV